MSVFLEWNHLFLRSPHGGVENVNAMKAAGFNVIFVNIKDYPLEEWDIVRRNAAKAAVPCGPWSRTTEGDEFDPNLLENLITVADAWRQPFIVNSEAELKGSGSDLTSYIAEQCEDRDWALSMEPWPFANVDWRPINVPVLPQCFGPDWADAAKVRDAWQRNGVRCVVPTFGTYSGWQPDLYPLHSPYGLYTADDCGNNFARWQATGAAQPCREIAPPTNGDDMEKIGPQHGVTAAMNRLRDLDPKGTALQKQGDKWPPLSTLEGVDIGTWKAYDKLERTLTILVTDHDSSA